MSKYGDDPLWADITPILQDDGGPNPLAAILYKESYSEAMSYLRAVMAQNERSERALSLTEDVIASSPAHYTVWLYRAKVLFTLNKDLKEELEWMNPTALKHQKNYQIWHHRRMMIEKLQQRGEEVDVESEIRFLDQMFAKDAKNYHVWSYKQWLVKTFDLWDTGEIEWSESMLETDVRNNSVWNYRWYLNFGKDDGAAVKDDAVREREIEYALPWQFVLQNADAVTDSQNPRFALRLRTRARGIISAASSGSRSCRVRHCRALLSNSHP